VKKYFIVVAILIVGLLYIVRPYFSQKKPALVQQGMKFSSPAFENYQKIPAGYTCDGRKAHPPLSLAGIPADAKSLVIIVDDPDAPGGTFTHWVIWNINPSTEDIAESSIPEKSQEGTNSAGSIGFTPPCPPSGQHRYFFTLYALDAKLGLDGKATKADVEKSMSGHVMAESLLVGVYSR
jgi:Raf kinase inhibitor-like YbhB/YbcL family protein